MFSQLFIDRPVLASVLSILIVILGTAALVQLPVAQFPEVAPPQVQVEATYPGASAQVLEETVATPIEQQVNGVDRMLYMKSQSSNDGRMTLTVTFEIGTDLDTATMLVQNRVAQVQSRLPEEVIRQGITVRKSQTDLLLVVALSSPNRSYDAVFLSNYASINVIDAILRVPGVGNAQVFGARDYSMRIWVRPDRLAGLGLTASDLFAAIGAQNIQAPAGQIGGPPAAPGQEFQYTVRTRGRLSEPAEFEAIILRSNPDGSQVRIRDVARVELGAQFYSSFGRVDGAPGALIGIFQTPGANALATTSQVKATLEQLSQRFPPDLRYVVSYDTTLAVSASIEEIVTTLFEAVGLVLLVVYVFLQSARATLIPLLTIPVSLVGTFALFPFLGFSVNTLSLFGLVLAIGIVVDDAIVVVEAVQHHIERGLPPREATLQAMREVGGPVVAIALILCAVFVPVALMGGVTGRLYQPFALTIAISVVLSALNALTLSPALSALLLRPAGASRGLLGRFFAGFDRGFARVTRGYLATVRRLTRRPLVGLLVLAIVTAGAVVLVRTLPAGFLPDEDQGALFMNVQLPDGASLDRTLAVFERVEGVVRQTPGVQVVNAIGGLSLLTGANQSNAGTLIVTLAPWEERTTPATHVTGILASLNRQFGALPDATVFAFAPPPIRGLGFAGGFQLELQDRGGGTITQLADETARFLASARQRPELANVFSGFRADVPQVAVELDREKARTLGVDVLEVFTTLQTFLGGGYVNDFNKFGRVYRVYIQADPEFRTAPEDIGRFYVRGRRGDMVPLSTLVRLGPASGPEFIQRYNLYRTAEISGGPAPGQSSGQAIAVMEQLARETLPREMGYEWTGTALQEIQSGGQAPVAFGLALVFVFLLLAALYESWTLPASVLLGVPLAAFGAFLAIWLGGFQNNVYAQIALVLLVGLAAKNAILIVEFAKLRREAGQSVVEAALEAAGLRFRPILMTSFAFIFGVIPLMLASGSGAAARRVLGTAVFGGMLAATALGVLLIPGFYVVVQGVSERLRRPGAVPLGAPPSVGAVASDGAGGPGAGAEARPAEPASARPERGGGS